MRMIVATETYQDGAVIIREGSFGEGTYVLLDGKVEISRTIDGRKVVIATLEKGDVFGEISYIDRQPRSASVIALGAVTVGLLNKDCLEAEMNKTSEEFRMIMKAITNRLRKTTGELVSLKTGYYSGQADQQKG
ncbi:MAG: cyclic nucleotide-binding domain-containing protein [Nitrospiraceae bacterium]|nr:cyclic nucleotide-binding domain-containing protein [Nitrospiraceae bacterium]